MAGSAEILITELLHGRPESLDDHRKLGVRAACVPKGDQGKVNSATIPRIHAALVPCLL